MIGITAAEIGHRLFPGQAGGCCDGEFSAAGRAINVKVDIKGFGVIIGIAGPAAKAAICAVERSFWIDIGCASATGTKLVAGASDRRAPSQTTARQRAGLHAGFRTLFQSKIELQQHRSLLIPLIFVC